MEAALEDLKIELVKHLEKTLSYMTKRPAKDAAEALLSWERANEQYEEMVSSIGNVKNKKLLEVGCGFGLFLTVCLQNKVKAEGVEPASEEYYQTTIKTGKNVLKRAGFDPKVIKKGYGENLPYESETFDLVVSFFTIEHVQNVKKVFEESARVLKPGGILYFVVPNFGSFWESHYCIIWPPYVTKKIAKIYVRFFGKDPKLLDELQLVNQHSLNKDLKDLPLKILDWGKKSFFDKFTNLKFSELNTGRSAKKIITILKTLRILKMSAVFLNMINAQTPIVLIARKKYN